MMSSELMHGLRACALAVIFALSGCASGADRENAETSQSFEASLHQCRKLQPGRLNQRMNLPPTSLRISRCLRKLGWQPDGSRYEPASE